MLWIDGKWTSSDSEDRIEVINPADGEVFASVPDGSEGDFVRAVEAAEKAFYEGPWRETPPAERSKAIWRMADLVEQRLDEIAALESRNTGKPFELQSKAVDISDSIDNLRFYATLARDTHGITSGDYIPGITHMFRHEAAGVAGQITPWNYPFQMAAWKIGPALAAGCTIVLKPASNTPLTSLLLGEIAKEAGIPDGVLNIVTGRGAKAEVLATHPSVRIVSLTGSTATGRRIMELASGTIKRTHLELGGKAPLIVFSDADIRRTAEKAVLGATFNAGQDCTAATRIYAEESIVSELTDAVVAAAEAVKVGNPFDSGTEMGPLISARQLERVGGFVDRARASGASVLTGGSAKGGDGYYYMPTVVSGAAQDSELIQEEIFGPVLTVSSFKTEEEAVRLGNDVVYGLAASVWTPDIAKAMRVSHRLEFGTV